MAGDRPGLLVLNPSLRMTIVNFIWGGLRLVIFFFVLFLAKSTVGLMYSSKPLGFTIENDKLNVSPGGLESHFKVLARPAGQICPTCPSHQGGSFFALSIIGDRSVDRYPLSESLGRPFEERLRSARAHCEALPASV